MSTGLVGVFSEHGSEEREVRKGRGGNARWQWLGLTLSELRISALEGSGLCESFLVKGTFYVYSECHPLLFHPTVRTEGIYRS